ncbi:hypothetical protein E4U58_005700 [Claviceps cyperi]|nr:hypothetical protein E4U58_005700 [Claviceps cyperi]
MRLLTLLTFASGALALATGPVHRSADQQAVDDDASLPLENAALANHEITRRDEEALQSLERRGYGASMRGVMLPRSLSPAATIINGVKFSYTMALHWVKSESGAWVYDYYVKSIQVFNQLNKQFVVQIIAAGQKARESPHIHVPFWIKGAPTIDPELHDVAEQANLHGFETFRGPHITATNPHPGQPVLDTNPLTFLKTSPTIRDMGAFVNRVQRHACSLYCQRRVPPDQQDNPTGISVGSIE